MELKPHMIDLIFKHFKLAEFYPANPLIFSDFTKQCRSSLKICITGTAAKDDSGIIISK